MTGAVGDSDALPLHITNLSLLKCHVLPGQYLPEPCFELMGGRASVIDPSWPVRTTFHVARQQKNAYYGLSIPVVDET
jgi:hypothetical protein